jgi:RimJ/RimL family protein N-acetyltransferase
MNYSIETPRLILRQWKDCDYAHFYRMGQCTDVMKYFPGLLNNEQSKALADKFRTIIDTQGWGFWAIELKASRQFIGFTGLYDQPEQFSFSPCTETGWRLSADCWGQGFATEAAIASLHFAFEILKKTEMVAFTASQNKPSLAVMHRLGMDYVQDFDHPALQQDHPLRKHLLYKITREAFQENHGEYGLNQSVRIEPG